MKHMHHQVRHHGKQAVHHVKKHGRSAWDWVKHHTQIVFLSLASLAVVLVGIFIIWIATMNIPTPQAFIERKVTNATKIYDRTGTVVLYDVFGNMKRTTVSSDMIDPKIKQAIVAIEDKEFYNHIGIVPRSIVRAVISQFVPGFPNSGGSTITQQLVKNTLLTQEKSIVRKIKEWVLAVKIERVMSKEEILTSYLNEAPYGGTIYGVEEASKAFFGKPAVDVTLAEAAYLAAIPNLPTYYSPYGKNRENLNARKNLILREMRDQGTIAEEQYTTARNEEVEFKPRSDGASKAIHFVEYVRGTLEEKYGRDAVLYGGLQVITTLDWDIQQAAEKAVLENALKNETAWGASNSAAVAIDPKTGQILAMVGSRDYSDREIDGAFNVATANRQPGSSFKSLVYARAFEKGFQPETVVFDVPTQFGPCDPLSRSMTSPCYAPGNFDGAFKGPMSLLNALGQSRNIPAVKMLSMIGLSDALGTAKRLGLTTLDRNADRYGLTLVLGGGEVTLLDLTSVYGVFANEGVRNPHTPIIEVRDITGTILEKFTPRPESVMDANATRKLSYVLSNNSARTPLLGANSFMYFGENRPVAAKTGTTSDNKDAWVVGYSPSVAVGVWSGNNDNTPMRKGSSISGPAWRAIMDAALKKVPYDRPGSTERFADPYLDTDYDQLAPVLRGQWAGGESFFVDTISGGLATDLTPRETKKEFVIPNPKSILYWVDVTNVRGPRPSNPESNPQFTRWNTAVLNWLSQNPGSVPGNPTKPSFFDNVHTEQNKPKTTINPIPEMVYGRTNPFTVNYITESKYPILHYEIFLNDLFVGKTSNLSFTFIPDDYNAISGKNILKIITVDEIYNREEIEVEVVVN